MTTTPIPDAGTTAAPATPYANAEAAQRPPDRLDIDPRSKFFNEDALRRGIGIRFKGAERNDVEAYCVSEGWIQVASARGRDRRGQPLMIKLQGTVEAYFKAPD